MLPRHNKIPTMKPHGKSGTTEATVLGREEVRVSWHSW